MLVPLVAAAFACGGMFGVVAPAGDRGLVLEIGDGDAEASAVAGRFHAEETGLLRHQLLHALRRRGVTVVAIAAPGTEDHRVVRRLRQAGERARKRVVAHRNGLCARWWRSF